MAALKVEDYYRAADDGPYYHQAVWRAQEALGSTGGLIKFEDQPLYPMGAEVPITKRVWLRGLEGGQTTDSTTQLRFVACPGFHIVFPGNPAYPEAVNGFARISDMVIFRQGGPTQALDHHGIRVDRALEMSDVMVFGFPGYGVVNDSTYGPPAGANCCPFYNVRVYNAGRSGWLFRGGDANKCTLTHCWADLCGMRRLVGDNHGFYEDSLIGNMYVGCHSDLGAANPGGRTYYSVRESNASSFHGCYSEGPNVEITNSSQVHGGPMAPAPGVRLNGILHGTPMVLSDYAQRTYGPGGVTARYGRYNTNEIWDWKSTNDPVGVKMVWSDVYKSWITLHSGATGLAGYGVTGATHPRGKGLANNPRGVLVGAVRHSGGVAPPAVQPVAPDALWQPGDIFWHAAGTPPERWRCIATDPDGTITWDPIG